MDQLYCVTPWEIDYCDNIALFAVLVSDTPIAGFIAMAVVRGTPG